MSQTSSDWVRLIAEAESAQARAQAAVRALRQAAPDSPAPSAGSPVFADVLARISSSGNTDPVIAALCEGIRGLAPDVYGAVLLQTADGQMPRVVAVWQPDEQWVDSMQGLHRHQDDRRPAALLESLQATPPDRLISLPLESLGLKLGEVRLWRADGPLASLPLECRTLSQVAALALAGLRLRVTAQSRAVRDPLTGLFNRRYLEDTLPREFHRCGRADRPLGLVSIDLDGFRQFNHRHGTVSGDRLLLAIGGLLQSSFRGSDICCRTEGGQFLVVLPEADLDNTRQRAEELLPMIAGLTIGRGSLSLTAPTASIGVAVYPEQAQRAEDLLDAADSARLLARQAGGNQVRVAERIEERSP